MSIREPNDYLSTEYFLDTIHGPNASIYFQVANKTWKNKPQTYAQAKNKLLWLNEQGKDICFIVNSGGSKDEVITTINSVYADLDSGRDISGNYYSLDIVYKKKALFLSKIYNFPLLFSFLIETRNGYHPYYLLYSGTTKEQFIEIQKRIAYYFGSDNKVCNPARVMRLPGYKWIKPNSNCLPFNVRIIGYNDIRYSINKLLSYFPSVPNYLSLPNNSSIYSSFTNNRDIYSCSINKSILSSIPLNEEKRKSAHNNINTDKDNTLDINVGTKPRHTPMTVFDTIEEVGEYLKRQNLAEYMRNKYKYKIINNGKSILCPFHNDKTPSASIYFINGVYMFKCFSPNCSFGNGTIIDVVGKIDHTDDRGAISILMKDYNLKIDDLWLEKEKGNIQNNIYKIERIHEEKEKYPYLCKYIGRIRKDLISKLWLAKQHICFRNNQKQAIFACSLRKFEREGRGSGEGSDLGRQNERIDRYCLLGLLRKIKTEEIPQSLLNTLRKYKNLNEKKLSSEKNTKIIFPYRTQCYAIPEYTDLVLAQADETARRLKEANITMNSISRDVVMDIFGLEKAKEIYPQVKADEITESGKKFRSKVESLLLEDIQVQGYSRVVDIVGQMQKTHDWTKIADRRVKKYIPGLLRKYNLKNITANKEMKNKYGIQSAGYPKIIIRILEVAEERTAASINPPLSKMEDADAA